MPELIISDVRPRVQYTADGVQTNFPYPFPILDQADLVVVFNDNEAPGANAISGVGESNGGTVAFDLPPASGTRITIYRDMAFARETDFQEAGDFRAAVINEELDRMAMLLQQAEMLVADSLHKSVYEAGPDLVLPSVAARAGKVLTFDGDGLPIIGSPSEEAATLAATSATASAASATASASSATDAAAAAVTALQDLVDDATPQLGAPLDTNAQAINQSEGTAVASAATTDIWVTDGNTLHITGTVTITSFGTAPRVGAWRKVIFDGALTLTDGVNLNLPGGANLATSLDDFAWVYAQTTTRFKVLYFKADGTAVAASSVADTLARDNIMLNAFRIAINGGLSFLNMQDGIVDEFEDETGVDTATSTNESYDATNDLYSPTKPYSLDKCTGGTASTDNGSYPERAFANDGDTTIWYTSDGGTASFPSTLKYDFGAGISHKIVRLKMTCPGSTVYMAKSFTIEGSNDNSSWTVLDTQSSLSWSGSEIKTFDFSNTTAYRYIKIRVTATNDAADWCLIAEVEMMTQVPADMALQSNPFTAIATPADARIVVFEENVDSVTLNTDLKAFVSRDGGTNFTQITLLDEGDYATGKQILAGSIDISGQPSGTSMQWKLTTHNAKELKVHGVALQWS